MLASVEGNELLLPTMWLNLRDEIPSERNRTPKTSYHMIAFLGSSTRDKTNIRWKKVKRRAGGSRLVAVQNWLGRGDWNPLYCDGVWITWVDPFVKIVTLKCVHFDVCNVNLKKNYVVCTSPRWWRRRPQPPPLQNKSKSTELIETR